MALEDFEGGSNGNSILSGTILEIVDPFAPPLFSNEHARGSLSAGPPATLASTSSVFGFQLDDVEPIAVSGWCYLIQNLDEVPGHQWTTSGSYPLGLIVGADFGLGGISYFMHVALMWMGDPEGFDTMEEAGLYWAYPDSDGFMAYDLILGPEDATNRWLQLEATLGTAGGIVTLTGISLKAENGSVLWTASPEHEFSLDASGAPYVFGWGGQTSNATPGEQEGIGLARNFVGAWVDDLAVGDVEPEIEGFFETVRRIFV